MRIVAEVDGKNMAVEIGPSRPSVRVGRLRECDLMLSDPSVSRRHAEFRWSGGQVEIVDLGSSAGTFVNGRRIQHATVEPTDHITVATVELKLEGDAPAPRRAREPEPAPAPMRDPVADAFSDDVAPDGAVPLPDPSDPFAAIPSEDDIWAVDDGFGGGRSKKKKSKPEPEMVPASEAEPSRRQDSATVAPHAGTLDSPLTAKPERGAAGVYELTWDGGSKQVSPSEGPYVIGRRSDCDIHIQNPTVGRAHARIGFINGEFKVVDLKSSNGTFVNGERVREAALADGDEVKLGMASMRVVHKGSAGGGAAAPVAPLDDWEEDDGWYDDFPDSDDTFEMQPPTWHLLFVDDDDRVTAVSMSLTMRVLAIGSDRDCEISIRKPGVEAEHVEVTWDQGALLVRDLGTVGGTLLNGDPIDEETVLRNQDRFRLGSLRVRVVRGSEGQRAKPTRTPDADFWQPILQRREDALSLTYIEFDKKDPEKRRELTIWGDGDGSLEVIDRDERSSVAVRARNPALDIVFGALIRGGFPECATNEVPEGEEPPEVECYIDGESAHVILSRKNLSKNAHYREVSEMLGAIMDEAMDLD